MNKSMDMAIKKQNFKCNICNDTGRIFLPDDNIGFRNKLLNTKPCPSCNNKN